MPSRFGSRLAVIAALAAAWRVAYVWIWKAGDTDLTDEGDAFYYGPQAVANAAGDFFRHPFTGEAAADHPPMTALLLTPISWLDGVFGEDISLAQRHVMVAIGLAVVVVVGLVGRRLAGERAGLVAAAIAAAYGALWLNDALLMAEAPAALLTALALLVALGLHDQLSWRRGALLGALIGLAALTRAELLLLLPLLLAVPVARSRLRWRQRLGASCAALAATIVVLAPWVGWNMARFEEPTLLSTNDGLTLVGANCPTTYHGSSTGFWDIRCALDHPVEGDQSQESAGWRRRGLTYARDNVERLPAVVLARVGRVWSVYAPAQMVDFNTGEGRERWASWVGMVQWWLLAPLAVVGGVVLWRRQQPVAPFVATALLVTFTAAAFYGLARFRLPVDVAAVVLAAVAVDAVLGEVGFPLRSTRQ